MKAEPVSDPSTIVISKPIVEEPSDAIVIYDPERVLDQSGHVAVGVQPGFQCHTCGASLSSQAALNMHLRTHTGEKPYSCLFCTYSAAQSNSVTIHCRSKHGNLLATLLEPGEKLYRKATKKDLGSSVAEMVGFARGFNLGHETGSKGEGKMSQIKSDREYHPCGRLDFGRSPYSEKGNSSAPQQSYAHLGYYPWFRSSGTGQQDFGNYPIDQPGFQSQVEQNFNAPGFVTGSDYTLPYSSQVFGNYPIRHSSIFTQAEQNFNGQGFGTGPTYAPPHASQVFGNYPIRHSGIFTQAEQNFNGQGFVVRPQSYIPVFETNCNMPGPQNDYSGMRVNSNIVQQGVTNGQYNPEGGWPYSTDSSTLSGWSASPGPTTSSASGGTNPNQGRSGSATIHQFVGDGPVQGGPIPDVAYDAMTLADVVDFIEKTGVTAEPLPGEITACCEIDPNIFKEFFPDVKIEL